MRLPFIFLALLLSVGVFGQKKVKLKKADNLFGSMKNGERFDRLLGNVVLQQNKTTIYCDSAHFFKTQNRVEAFGRIRITEGDSVNCTANGLSYDGNSKVAYLRKNVVFTKLGLATLYTDFLDYDRVKNEARYFNGGKLVDSTNTLTSKKGYYFLPTNLASFKTDVVGVNPDYTLTSDTLQYNSKTKIIYFRDSTVLKDKDGQTAVYQNGFYNTTSKTSNLNNGEIETPNNRMKGDKYYLDDIRKYYRAQGRVAMTSKEDNMTVFGDDGFYDRKKGISKVYGNAYVAKVADDGDTLFLSADTLVSIESVDPKKKRLLAYNHVRIFKRDLQGSADSLAYMAADSVLHMYKNPILWANENQLTADSIRMLMKNKAINRIYLVANAFVIQEDSLQNYNQIKGRKMTAYFEKSVIDHVIVQGNGESIYFATQDEKITEKDTVKTITVTTALNKIICSNMRINFRQGKVNNISFYIKPDAQLIPPNEWKPEDQRLRGFAWRSLERPLRKDVVKTRPPTKSNDK
jgi:lipopolysaccharide export system protein LptA